MAFASALSDHRRNGRLRLGAALGQAGRGNPPGDAVWFSPALRRRMDRPRRAFSGPGDAISEH